MAKIEHPQTTGDIVRALEARLRKVETSMASKAQMTTFASMIASLQSQITQLQASVASIPTPPPTSPGTTPPYVPTTTTLANISVPAQYIQTTGGQIKLASTGIQIPKSGTLELKGSITVLLQWWNYGTPHEVWTHSSAGPFDAAHAVVTAIYGGSYQTISQDNSFSVAAGNFEIDWFANLGSGNRLQVSGGSLQAIFTG